MELRATIKKLWPLQAKKNLDFIVPPDDGKAVMAGWGEGGEGRKGRGRREERGRERDEGRGGEREEGWGRGDG